MESNVEEADSQLVSHIGQVFVTGIIIIVAFSQDSDVVIFLSYQMYEFWRQGAQEVMIRHGTISFEGNPYVYRLLHHQKIGKPIICCKE